MVPNLNIFKDQTILITGGGGYLGSKLAKVLSKSDARLKLLDITFNQISNSLAASNSKIELFNIDLTDKKSLVSLIEKIKPDYIFHFAASLDRTRDFEIYENLFKINVGGTFNLLEALKDCDYKDFIFASTSEVYGTRNQVPFHEKQVPEPSSPYSLTKLMAENLLKTHSTLYSKPFIVLRLFNFFGPDMPEETFIGQMLAHYRNNKIFHMTPGNQKRDLTYIDDVINQILFLVNSETKLLDTFNICSNNSYEMIQIARAFKEITDGKFEFETSLNYRPNEIWETHGSNQRILNLNYIPKNSSLKENLIKTIA